MLTLSMNIQSKSTEINVNDVSKLAGFTLIEMMIVVSVIGILAAIGLPSYQTLIQNAQIRTAAESIQAGLQKARVEAVKRNVQVRFVLGTNSAWSISCVTAAQCADLTGGVFESRSAKEGTSTNITVTPDVAGADTIIFTNLGTVQSSPPAPTVPFTQLSIDSTAIVASESRDLSIRLGAGGFSRICDPYTGLSLTDPRRC